MAQEEIDDILNRYARFLDSQGSHLTYSALSIYRNSPEELSAKERLFLEGHVSTCQDCSAKLKEVAEVESAGYGSGTILRRITPTLRYAVAAIFVVGLGVTALLMRTSNGSVPSGGGETSGGVEALDPARFLTNPILENFINRTIRSTANVNLLVPALGDTVSIPFSVRWDGEEGKQGRVILIDNTNEEVWSGSSTVSGVAIEQPLRPGLYYLKLEINGDLTLVGKFFILR